MVVLSNRVRYSLVILSLRDRRINKTRVSIGSNRKDLWKIYVLNRN